ncbi:MAG: discoidin domain-containing protein [Kiritimatiellae bacterium]|nr:discoidin domain-containing protein [Kiritimatiellia bacterium]
MSIELYVAASIAVSTLFSAVAANPSMPLTLRRAAGKAPEVVRIDLGAPSTGGYAVFDVTAFEGNPLLRIAYANHPDGLGEKGCFSRETSARYLGPHFDIPALPGNINRHEIYRICRPGRYVAPLIQGQERYARLQLDTPGSVTLSSFTVVNAQVFRDGEFEGSFSCSDDRLDRLWKISAWTCQIAAFPNHDAWKCAGGRLLPRKLEAASGDGWHRAPSFCDGTLQIEYEFDANPHFPQGRFVILVGDKRTEIVQRATNEVKQASMPIRKGERFGLSVEKESWPVISKIQIVDGDGAVRWKSRFDAADGLDEWEFPRTLSYVADGAKRDRLIWSGDLWWAERNLFYSFNPGDEPYMRGSVKMLGFNQTPAGYVHACPYAERATPPKDGEYGPFPSDEFAAWFIPVLRDYYLYSGDAATARALYPNVVKLMDYLAAHTEKDGTFIQRPETSKHACNLNLGDTSHRAYMDLLLWMCCQDAASMAADFGDDAGRIRYGKWAEKLSTAIRSRFWNEAEGFFMLSDNNHGFGFEANALALAARFVTRDEALRIAPALTHTGHGKFQALAARGLMEYGFMDHGIKAIAAHNWFKLLDPKWPGALTTTECMGMHRVGWGDESHPDTAIAGVLSAGVLGVTPTAPGYAKFQFRPQPCASMTRANGKVPTPHGAINAAWRLDGNLLRAELEVPAGTTASVVLPKGTSVALNGSAAKGLDALAPGKYEIVVSGIPASVLADPVAAAEGTGPDAAYRFTASSSHEDGGWGLQTVSMPKTRHSAKGWSSKPHPTAKSEEWLEIDLGNVKSMEKLTLWPRNDTQAVNGGTAGFPKAFVVEGMDDSGAWRSLASFNNVKPPANGSAFIVDFYTVIGFPKVKRLRIRATELGDPPSDETTFYRFQLRRVSVTAR